MKPRKLMILLFAGLVFTLSNRTIAATCGRECLLDYAKQFNANMLGHTPAKIPLVANANVRENTKAIALIDSKWNGVTKILSQGLYTDPTLGTVIEHVAAETSGGKVVYIGTRLKLADGKIKEVEINFDDGPRVNVKNLVPYDPIFDTIVPPEERSTREELVRIITDYFKGLTDLTTIPFKRITIRAATATTAETALHTTRKMASSKAATTAATRATLDRNLGGQQPRCVSVWSTPNAEL
jgi:hypothetical protein